MVNCRPRQRCGVSLDGIECVAFHVNDPDTESPAEPAGQLIYHRFPRMKRSKLVAESLRPPTMLHIGPRMLSLHTWRISRRARGKERCGTTRAVERDCLNTHVRRND